MTLRYVMKLSLSKYVFFISAPQLGMAHTYTYEVITNYV